MVKYKNVKYKQIEEILEVVKEARYLISIGGDNNNWFMLDIGKIINVEFYGDTFYKGIVYYWGKVYYVIDSLYKNPDDVLVSALKHISIYEECENAEKDDEIFFEEEQ